MGIETKSKKKAAKPRAPYRAIPPASNRTNLASALFTATQQRVLGLLFGQPERSFFATELIRLAGAGSGGVQREIRHLVESGRVTVTRVGNQKHYQANRAAPIYAELRGIVVKTLGPAGVLRDALVPLQSQIHLAVLYGWVAKRTDSAASDIDVLVVADDLTLEAVYAALAPAEKRLARRVTPTLYNVQEFHRRQTARNPFISKVLAGEYITLMGGTNAHT